MYNGMKWRGNPPWGTFLPISTRNLLRTLLLLFLAAETLPALVQEPRIDVNGSGAWQYGAGVEYTYHQLLSLRVGYYGQSTVAGGQKGFTAGLGLQWSTMALNLSYLAPSGNGGTGGQNPLSNTLRFGLVFGK